MEWWTMFYWGWWISWAPFVGMFVAIISRGRTIRQVIGKLLALSSCCGLFSLLHCRYPSLNTVIGQMHLVSERFSSESVLVAILFCLLSLSHLAAGPF